MDRMDTMKSIAGEVSVCKKCRLWKTRAKTVPGEGPENAKILLVGEAPGRNEDKTGRPFVGPAGKLLASLLEEARIDRSQVFITSILKCRPVEFTGKNETNRMRKKNRKPKTDEINRCVLYLLRQIEAMKPDVVCLMGKVAFESVSEFFMPEISYKEAFGKVIIADACGKKICFITTYHPAYGIYNRDSRKIITAHFKRLQEQKF